MHSKMGILSRKEAKFLASRHASYFISHLAVQSVGKSDHSKSFEQFHSRLDNVVSALNFVFFELDRTRL